MSLHKLHNYHDFKRVAKQRLPSPIYNYIAGGADDELTLARNTESFSGCDLVPQILRNVEQLDTSVTVMGQKLDVPFYCSPTALQRLFHYQGEHAVAAAAEKFGTMFGVSSLGTASMEAIRQNYQMPQMFQFYYHKDRGLNRAMIEQAKQAGIDVMTLTVDSITGGNRERDKRSGFSIPFRLTLNSLLAFALKPRWGINYITHEKFKLPQLEKHISMDAGAVSIARYFTEMLDQKMDWALVEEMVKQWDGQFCLKGVMDVKDAEHAVKIGCNAIILSNHGGRQLDGARSPFDQLDAVMNAVGDKIDVLIDSGFQRGTHVLKALSMGAKAVGLGRYYLFPLAAYGQKGVEYALQLMKDEIERDMRLMGVSKISELSRKNIICR